MNRQRLLSFALLICVTALASPSLAQSTIPTTWTVNGNGYTGVLVLKRIDSSSHEVNGTLLGTPVRGYLVGRHLVLHRFPQGETQIWDGWILDSKLGAHGQAYYDGTPMIAGLISESEGSVDGVYPWYAVAQAATSTPSSTNLILNGSFEEPPGEYLVVKAPPGECLVVKSGVSFPGWTVTRGTIDVCTNHWQSADGTRSVDLAGTPGAGTIQQTFPTTPSRRYIVRFALAGNPSCETPVKQMAVRAAGQSATFSFDTSGHSLRSMGWTSKQWEFTANAASTTLELAATSGNYCGAAVDDVVVLPR